MMAEHGKDKGRPLGVKLIAVLILLFGFSMFLPLRTSLLVLPLSLLFLAIVGGLWNLKGWAKSLALFFGALGLVLNPFWLIIYAPKSIKGWSRLSLTDSAELILMIIGIPLSVIILWCLTRPKVILAFERGEVVLARNKIRKLEEKIELGRERCNAGEITKAGLAKLKADCAEEERRLRAQIRHLDKVRLGRERKLKERAKAREEAKVEKIAKKEEKKAKKEERKAEKKAEKEAKKEEEEKEGEEGKEKEEEEGEAERAEGDEVEEEGEAEEESVKKKGEKKARKKGKKEKTENSEEDEEDEE